MEQTFLILKKFVHITEYAKGSDELNIFEEFDRDVDVRIKTAELRKKMALENNFCLDQFKNEILKYYYHYDIKFIDETVLKIIKLVLDFRKKRKQNLNNSIICIVETRPLFSSNITTSWTVLNNGSIVSEQGINLNIFLNKENDDIHSADTAYKIADELSQMLSTIEARLRR